jgi:eukaryotic-like serine/threonine-protein kinase
MVIIGQEFSGFTIVAVLDSPVAADVYRAIHAGGGEDVEDAEYEEYVEDAGASEVTLYLQEGIALSAQEFEDEVERLLALSRAVRGVVPILSAGVAGNTGWIATPAAEETPIEAVLQRFRPLAFEIVGELAKVLSGGHALGLVHGDVGPHNVLIAGDGVTTLRAFGFHRAFGAPSDEAAEAACYRAPEIFDGRTIDVRTDVYGLGMLLYCLLAGRAPFEGRGRHDEFALHENPEPIDGVPAWVDAALARALAEDPDARFQTLEELAAALRPLVVASDLPLVNASPSSPPPPPPDTERTAPAPASRDTLPTGTTPPEALRRPTVEVVDLGKRRHRSYVTGALLAAFLTGLAALVLLAPRHAPRGGAQEPGAQPAGVPSAAPPQIERCDATAPTLLKNADQAAQATHALPQSPASPLPVRSSTAAPATSADDSLHDDSWYGAQHY